MSNLTILTQTPLKCRRRPGPLPSDSRHRPKCAKYELFSFLTQHLLQCDVFHVFFKTPSPSALRQPQTARLALQHFTPTRRAWMSRFASLRMRSPLPTRQHQSKIAASSHIFTAAASLTRLHPRAARQASAGYAQRNGVTTCASRSPAAALLMRLLSCMLLPPQQHHPTPAPLARCLARWPPLP